MTGRDYLMVGVGAWASPILLAAVFLTGARIVERRRARAVVATAEQLTREAVQ